MVPPAPLNTRNALEWYILDTPRRIDLFKKKILKNGHSGQKLQLFKG